jgi:hypothetical protein
MFPRVKYRTVVRNFVISFGILATGIVVSLKSGDWTWFSRSGSALVAIGILFTSHQILEHSLRLKENRMRWEERSGHDWADENSIRKLIKARSREEDLWEIEFHGLYMLVVGTLVWGFGDLLGRLL